MKRYDVTVLGAGPAGICAALQSARLGASTLLIEKNGIPGGTITNAGVAIPGLFNAYGKQIIDGIAWELVQKTLLENGDPLPDFSRKMTEPVWTYAVEINPFLFASIAEEELLIAGAHLAYHTMPAKVQRNDSEWLLTLCGKDGLYGSSSKVLIDCSGDANLTKMAGYEIREPEECQPGTLSVHLDGGADLKGDLQELTANYLSAETEGKIRADDLHFSPDAPKTGNMLFLTRKGMNANHICGINAADSKRKTQMEIAGRQSVLRAYRFLRHQKGLENIRLRFAAPECGVRESRTIVGEYTVTEQDELNGTAFADAVCWNFYMLDLHDAKEGLRIKHLPEKVVPQVPFRALIPKDSVNFLAAGRIISSDRYANAALRVQTVCMATGQCAGAAAALSAEKGLTPKELQIYDLKKILLEHHAIIPENGYVID